MDSKKLKLFYFLSASLLLAALECWGETVPASKCQTEDPGLENNYHSLGYGSSGYYACEELSRGKMKSIYRSGGTRSADFKWDKYFDYKCREECKKSPEDLEKCKLKLLPQARKCESVAFLLSTHGRFDNDDNYREDSGRGANNNAMNGMQQAAAPGVPPVMSNNVCRSQGVETLDYDACVKFQSNLNIIEATQGIAYGAQGLIYSGKLLDSQLKNSENTNAATGALKDMKDSANMQKEMYQQRTAVDTAKLTYLYSIYDSMPTIKSVASDCEKISSVPITESSMPNNVVRKEDCLASARPGQSGFALFMNQAQSDNMKAKLASVFASAGSNALLASLMKKRAGDIGDAIAKIDAFKPIDPVAISEEDARTTFCQQNPGLPQCLTGGLERTFDPMGDNVITFGEGGTGTNYGTPNANAASAVSGGSADSTARKSVDSVGSPIAQAPTNNSIEGSTAAKVTDGATGESGGGGGAGSAGGAGGSSGNAPPLAKADPGGTQAAIQGKTPNYDGGGGSISVMGGLGINKAKKDGKTDDNPFSKLFGKESPKGAGVVNFRDLASEKVGTKGDNLFEMISKRYAIINGDKRLLEYELTH